MTTIFGTVRRAGERFDLDFERVYASSVEDVWDAVTRPERLARWMAPFEGDLRPGGRWRAVEDDGSEFSTGTVAECEPPHRYVTSWEYEGEVPSKITVTVTAHPEGAVLRLTHAGLKDVGYGAGWQAYLEQLDATLVVAPSCEVDPERAADVTWGERFAALDGPWREVIAAAR